MCVKMADVNAQKLAMAGHIYSKTHVSNATQPLQLFSMINTVIGHSVRYGVAGVYQATAGARAILRLGCMCLHCPKASNFCVDGPR